MSVDYEVRPGSARYGVTADYYIAETSGTLTFNPHQATKLVSVTVYGDRQVEGDETLTLRLSNPTGAQITDATAVGTIHQYRNWLKVHDATVREAEGAVLAFAVRLTRDADWPVSVSYRTSDGSAKAGSDYTARSGRLSFAVGEREKTIEVPVLVDDEDEEEETMTLSLSNPSRGTGFHIQTNAEATGTIQNDGPMPIGLVARFGRAMATHVVDQVEQRIEAPAAPRGYADFSRQFMPLAQQLVDQEGRRQNPRMGQYELDPLAGGLSFGQQTRGGGVLSFWTRSAQSSFNSNEGALAMGGDVRTTMVGADYSKGRMITGLSLARSLGMGNYAGTSRGEVTAALTGLYPWIGYQATDRVTVWGVAGYGAGRMVLTTGTGPHESGITMTMTAAGTRGELISGEAFDLAVKADAMWVGTSIAGSKGPNGNLAAAQAAVTRMRTGVEGSRSYTLMGRLALKPIVELGLRRDGGDAENGAGVDVGGGVVVADAASGLAVDVRVRTLVVHQAEEFSERGVAITFSYNPTSTPHGLSAQIAPAWGGNAMGSANTLWRGEVMNGLGYAERGGRLDGEVGYGLPVGRFVGTPRFGFSTASHSRVYRFGYGLTAAEAGDVRFELGGDVQRSESAHLPGANHGGMGRATVSW